MKFIDRVHTFLYTIKKICNCYEKGFPLSLATCCDVHPEELPKSTNFGHPFGIVIRKGTLIGEHCTIRQNVTIGQRKGETKPAMINDNVSIGAGAIILGNVSIGSNAIIGAGGLILKDVPDNSSIVGLWK